VESFSEKTRKNTQVPTYSLWIGDTLTPTYSISTILKYLKNISVHIFWSLATAIMLLSLIIGSFGIFLVILLKSISQTIKYKLRSELVKSQTAERKGIPNNPSPSHIDNLKALCVNVLQPIRSHFDSPVLISSGYRSAELCIAIGSKPTSQHSEGKAADIEVVGVDNKELAEWIRDNLEFDQLILEFYRDGEPDSGWIHVSWNSDNNRSQTLKALRNEDGKVEYKPW
jgi:zinc D-Ala-D-Ala carboxypeptidase